MLNISKHALRRLRWWARYQNETTIYEAHKFLHDGVRTSFDYETVRDINTCATEIREFLVRTCFYEKTRKVKTINGRPYIVFRNKMNPIGNTKYAKNFYGLMSQAYGE